MAPPPTFLQRVHPFWLVFLSVPLMAEHVTITFPQHMIRYESAVIGTLAVTNYSKAKSSSNLS